MTRKLILSVLVGLAVYYAFFGGEYSVFEVRSARAQKVEAQADLARLQAEIESLRDRAEALESDPAELERIAREKFGMIREGELLYRLVPEPPEEEPGADDAEAR